MALWIKKEPTRHSERDIVQQGPLSPFVDKWIFMLLTWDSDRSENCGKCGIIPSLQLSVIVWVVSPCLAESFL